MCGLAGYLGFGALQADEAPIAAQRMASAIRHRGPDDSGCWYDTHHQVALAHQRLSILDLSSAGHQPMISPSRRFVLVFNGEIYNHLSLRVQLEQAGLSFAGWRGHSDTETLLAGFESWGITETITRTVGMFALAVWDRESQTLSLARDRLGEKPLYYGWQGSGRGATFLFGSELKALKAHPAFTARVNRGALSLLMRHNYINAPESIYEGIYKLPPGHLLTVSLKDREPTQSPYWSLTDVAQAGLRNALTQSDAEITDALEHLLKSAVSQQMLSDVPLGAFLSGGIDSSTIVALMQAQSSKPVKTFTIGFHEAGYNEAVHARAVARHLGTEHTELYVTPQQALDVIPQLPSLYCEPFADSSQIPTFLVSQLARQQVTVSLSGDAGDELFGGYNRYTLTARLWNRLAKVPAPLRHLAAMGLQAVPTGVWNTMLGPVQHGLPRRWRMANPGDKLHKAAGVLGAHTVDELYLGLVSHWQPHDLVIDGQEPLSVLNSNWATLAGLDEVQRMMALDAITYLPGDILTKVDRAAMGVSLETRVPFLDHRVVEFAWRIPQHMKLRGGVGKWILRQVLYRHVPQDLVERPKMGFGVPIGEWLRGPLRDWAEDLLDEHRLRSEGYFHPGPVRKKWEEHVRGNRNWEHHLWDVLMFQAWLAEQSNSEP